MDQLNRTFHESAWLNWLDNEYISGALILFLVLYASAIAPKLPGYVLQWFDYSLVKLIAFFLIVYISQKNATVAIVCAIAVLATIMALNHLKIGYEMMAVTDPNSANAMNGYTCTCVLDDVKPQTDDGILIINELKLALAEGALSKPTAQSIAKHVVVSEQEGKPVLVAKTSEGNKKMEEIATAENQGTLSEQQAKKMEARVVVTEAVMEEQKFPSKAESIGEKSSGSLAEMAQEVKKRTQIATYANGGMVLTPDDMKNICASVVDYYKCDGNNSVEISGLDLTSTSYASANY